MQAKEKILILDYGSQFTQLIARKTRELGVFCEIHPHDAGDAFIRDFAADGIILSGGPQSALTADAPKIADAVFAKTPVLAVCYGMQAMMAHFGGELAVEDKREYGAAQVRLVADCPLWQGVEKADALRVWMSHGDRVVRLADGFHTVAESDDGVIAAVHHNTLPYYGLQFHPEVAHTQQGATLLDNFLRRLCGLRGEWTTPNFIQRAVADIRRQVGGDGVLLALSGGVDSAVVAALTHRAIGDQLVCVLVDNGLLRAEEAELVRAAFERHFGLRLRVVSAGDRFFAALADVADPEEKRRRIGALFVDVFEKEAKTLGDNVKWLAQGTIYPDVVESAKTGAGKATIKTHHNVGGLPARLNLRLLEPLRELFKDEVRRLGKALGLPRDLMQRHPFPGPGLAVRVLGDITPARVDMARRADAIFMDELRRADAYLQTAQAFTVLLPVQSVGVMGDSRTYENVVALRAVTTDDFMTADWARLDADLLARVSSRIINEVRGVNRVVYDISSKPPATVEWE